MLKQQTRREKGKEEERVCAGKNGAYGFNSSLSTHRLVSCHQNVDIRKNGHCRCRPPIGKDTGVSWNQYYGCTLENDNLLKQGQSSWGDSDRI